MTGLENGGEPTVEVYREFDTREEAKEAQVRMLLSGVVDARILGKVLLVEVYYNDALRLLNLGQNPFKKELT